MIRKEAEAEAKELNKRDPYWFCPLIKDICRKDCINFMPAFVESKDKKKAVSLHAVDDEDFFVDGFSCTNAMFSGNTLVDLGDK